MHTYCTMPTTLKNYYTFNLVWYASYESLYIKYIKSIHKLTWFGILYNKLPKSVNLLIVFGKWLSSSGNEHCEAIKRLMRVVWNYKETKVFPLETSTASNK